jgi:ADP-ribose pyrophosphatase YjhB (NUDIX family)
MDEKSEVKWEEFDKGVFLVNFLGIIFDPKTKKILIGRRENDPYIPELTWVFPGGRPEYEEELEDELKKQIKIKTNLDVEPIGVIFAKSYPEKREFISIYYLCEVTGGKCRRIRKIFYNIFPSKIKRIYSWIKIMLLKKCKKCEIYTLKDTCKKCKDKTSDAHYKFIKRKKLI